MISLHYTSHTKAYNTIYTACNIVEAIYSFTVDNMILFTVVPQDTSLAGAVAKRLSEKSSRKTKSFKQ